MEDSRQAGRVWPKHFIGEKTPAMILTAALALGLIIWVADALLDYVLFFERGFLELLLLNPPQHEIYIRVLIVLLLIAFGGVIAEIVLHLQTTQRELGKRETNLRTTLQSIGDGVIATDIRGRIKRMNGQSEKLTGWSRHEAMDQPLESVFRIVNAFSRKPVANPVRKVLEEGTVKGLANHTVLIANDGREFQIADSAAPIREDQGSIQGVVLVFRDVTEHYRQEQALRKERRRLANVIEGTGAGIWEMNLRTQELYFDVSWMQNLGYSPADFPEMSLRSWRNLLHPDDLQKSDRLLEEHLYGRLGAYECEIRMRHKDGSWVWIFDRGRVTERTEEGKALILSGTVQDISERKRAEEALRESERQLATLMGNLPGMAYRCLNDAHWTMLFVSQGCHPLTGYSPSELLQNRKVAYADLVHPEDQNRVWTAVQTGLAQSGSFEVEYRILTAAGEEKHVWEQGTGVSNDGELLFLEGFVSDITERKRAEERVNHLNQVLRAVRSVNQLITVEKDCERLIRGVCDNLVQTRGCHDAWIALLGDTGELAAFAEAGKDGTSSQHWPRRLQELPSIGKKALEGSDLVLLSDNEAMGIEKPEGDDQDGSSDLAVPLEHKGRVHGVLSLSLPSRFAHRDEEQALLRELAGDIGFSLSNIELEESHRRHESEREINLRLLSLLHRSESVSELVSEVIYLLREWSGCEAVGIRLDHGDDYPYYETVGFPEEHVRQESSLCEVDPEGETVRDFRGDPVLECMCGNVIRGRYDATLPFFTEYGSFWTNSTTELLASSSEEGRQARTRNRCHGEGFESVALIPLRHGERTLGLVQFNDSRRNRFDKDLIHLYEHLAESLALGFAQLRSKEALQESEQLFRQLFEQAAIGIIISSAEHTVIEANQKALAILGYVREELLHMHAEDILHPGDIEEIPLSASMDRMLSDKTVSMERRFRTKKGEYIDVLVNLARMPYYSEDASHMVMFQDITERKRMEDRLREMSLYDSLTGLYNRNFFEEEMARLSNGRSAPVGIVVCDLDGLKFVNDALGHQSGDELLTAASGILRRSFRSSDILARIGGDEFAVLLPESGQKETHKMTQRLRRSVEEYNNHSPRIPVSLSLGYAVSEKGPLDMQALFREADNRMYREKIQREQSARSAIVQGLTSAIEARDFVTEGHCDRLQELADPLARSVDLPEDRINDLFLFARFHDLGKVGIPDRILFKPGRLTDIEFQEMKRHSEIGHRIAQSVVDLEPIADWILKHHERWDGQGYPLGLSNGDIPLECRILAIVDAYDAMTSNRPYRRAMGHAEAVRELQRCSGTQFDPDLVEKFIGIVEASG
jgi:diguanylate cyclase (GGDEF)-like protein/PAS domain S-box-containing protein